MDRRKFLNSLISGIAASAAVRTFPFRVYSFPKEIVQLPLRIDDIRFYNTYELDGGLGRRHIVEMRINDKVRLFETERDPYEKLGEIWRGDFSGLKPCQPVFPVLTELILAADENVGVRYDFSGVTDYFRRT
jgi:hypothetical protein